VRPPPEKRSRTELVPAAPDTTTSGLSTWHAALPEVYEAGHASIALHPKLSEHVRAEVGAGLDVCWCRVVSLRSCQ